MNFYSVQYNIIKRSYVSALNCRNAQFSSRSIVGTPFFVYTCLNVKYLIFGIPTYFLLILEVFWDLETGFWTQRPSNSTHIPSTLSQAVSVLFGKTSKIRKLYCRRRLRINSNLNTTFTKNKFIYYNFQKQFL